MSAPVFLVFPCLPAYWLGQDCACTCTRKAADSGAAPVKLATSNRGINWWIFVRREMLVGSSSSSDLVKTCGCWSRIMLKTFIFPACDSLCYPLTEPFKMKNFPIIVYLLLVLYPAIASTGCCLSSCPTDTYQLGRRTNTLVLGQLFPISCPFVPVLSILSSSPHVLISWLNVPKFSDLGLFLLDVVSDLVNGVRLVDCVFYLFCVPMSTESLTNFDPHFCLTVFSSLYFSYFTHAWIFSKFPLSSRKVYFILKYHFCQAGEVSWILILSDVGGRGGMPMSDFDWQVGGVSGSPSFWLTLKQCNLKKHIWSAQSCKLNLTKECNVSSVAELWE